MQQLTINLIPLGINNAIAQCSFYIEKCEGHIHYTKGNNLANHGIIIRRRYQVTTTILPMKLGKMLYSPQP